MRLHLHDYTFQRYLAAKRTVDDRALNSHVWETLHSEIARRVTPAAPFTVLEIGGGIGTMVERLLEEDRLPPTNYHLVDEQADNIADASQRLHQRFAASTMSGQSHLDHTFNLAPTYHHALTSATGKAHSLNLYPNDLFDFLDNAGTLATVDLVLAHAFMDLVDIPATLPRFTATLRPGSLLYLTINFDGATIFEPTIDTRFDDHIEQVYHGTMDERITNGKRSGDSQTGRHLFHQLKTANIHTLDAGSSDWVIIPHHATYPHDEAYFLHFIIHTMHNALCTHPDIDPARFEQWIATRHAQIEQGELVYIAHQLDYLGEYQPPTTATT